MSLFNKIFGKNGKEKPPTPQEAIQRIRDVEELLNKKSEYLEKKVHDELDVARKHGTKNKRCIHILCFY
jgi:charged multivesicular body protein 4